MTSAASSDTPPARATWRAWLRLVRAPNTVTAMADVFAGAAVAGLPFTDVRVCGVAAGSALLYAGGVAWNDIADLEKDRALHPERPLPAGLIRPARARLVATALMLLGVGTGWCGAPALVLVTLALAVAILAYDHLPETAVWSGPVLMAVCRALNLGRGLALGAALAPSGMIALAVHAALIFAVTRVSLREERPDGARPWPALATIGVAILAGPPLIAALTTHAWLPVLGCSAMLTAFVMRGAAGRTVGVVPRAIFSLTLLDALTVGATGDYAGALAVAALFPASRLAARLIAQRGS